MIRFTVQSLFVAAVLFSLSVTGCRRGEELQLVTNAAAHGVTLPADGRIHRVGAMRLSHGRLNVNDLIIKGRGTAVQSADGAELLARSPVSTGRERLRISHDHLVTSIDLLFSEDVRADGPQPGLPDWMPMHTAEDRSAFRRWFVAVAERVADLQPKTLPKEISDCSALLRYSFREALRAHDDKWYAQLGPEEMPSLPSVQQWTYPNTPLNAGLFRTRPGSFVATDLSDGTFAQFADAKTLIGANTFFVSRTLARARPGDLIFYRLLEGASQYHSMIVTGDHAEWVVYHTGPVTTPQGKAPGEMRRVLLTDLVKHPDPRWRPVPANENFLGVYRWDILDDDSN